MQLLRAWGGGVLGGVLDLSHSWDPLSVSRCCARIKHRLEGAAINYRLVESEKDKKQMVHTGIIQQEKKKKKASHLQPSR